MTSNHEISLVPDVEVSGHTSDDHGSGIAATFEKVHPDVAQMGDEAHHLGRQRETMILIFITLSQLVQMIPLGVGINRQVLSKARTGGEARLLT